MYKLLIQDEFDSIALVKRLSDNAFIPFDPANTDYQKYLEWLAEGNTPVGADDPLPAEPTE